MICSRSFVLSSLRTFHSLWRLQILLKSLVNVFNDEWRRLLDESPSSYVSSRTQNSR
uniref:Uncharacterized protein n=1 Tax=Arundo donax TaxID=35708 RepID=A0A0A9AYG9_ARUDO